jgi:hypothetical protein
MTTANQNNNTQFLCLSEYTSLHVEEGNGAWITSHAERIMINMQ